MKTNLFLLLIFLGPLLPAQTFMEVFPPPPFPMVVQSGVAFADIDGDNDSDIFISGASLGTLSANLYINDGVGNFTQSTHTFFEGISNSVVAFEDVNGDNAVDLLIIGWDFALFPITKLYRNDGSGNFIEWTGNPFEKVAFGSIDFADIDGDNDPDVFISGVDSTGVRLSNLYLNNGAGYFTKVTGTPFAGIIGSSSAFSDVDRDNDQDLLITGYDGSVQLSKLYLNDGAGNFTEIMGTPFERATGGSIAFSDIDGDNDEDVLITGYNGNIAVSKLYANDGEGNFTEIIETPFEAVSNSDIAVADVDRDNDLDILITGLNNALIPISKLYLNDGAGNFKEELNTPFVGVYDGSVDFADVDGDNNPDVLITGRRGVGDTLITKLYRNTSTVSIEPLIGSNSFEFMIYPNPTKAEQIDLNYHSSKNTWIKITIFDLQGRHLQQQEEHMRMGAMVSSIDISSLKPGCYFIQLDDGIKQGTRKLVVH